MSEPPPYFELRIGGFRMTLDSRPARLWALATVAVTAASGAVSALGWPR